MVDGSFATSSRKIQTTATYASVTSGLLYGLAFAAWPGIELGWLAWCCLVPLLHNLARLPQRQAFAHYVIFTFTGSLIAGRWVLMAGLGVGMVAIMWHTVLLLPPLLLGHVLQRHVSVVWGRFALPFLWAAWEACADMLQPFHWAALGESQAGLYWLVQYADLTGAWGITCWVVLCNVWLCQLLQVPRWRLRPALTAGIAVLWGLPGLYAFWIFQQPFNGQHPLQVAWIQPGVSQLAHSELLKKSRQAIEQFRPALLLWPESVAWERPFYRIAHDKLAWLLTQHDTALLAAYVDERYPQGIEGAAIQTNQALLATADDVRHLLAQPKANSWGWLAELDNLPIQVKRRLVPHEEQRLLPDWLAQWLWSSYQLWLPNLTPGTTITPMYLTDTQQLGVLLCYEAYFPIEAALRVQAGANMLVVLANELSFGSSIAAWQSMTFVRLRAIENRRFVVRASAGAYSAWIDPWGRVLEQAPATVQTGAWQVPMLNEQSFFSRFPHAFVMICVCISLIFLWPLSKMSKG